jgi:signal transduction histidine kinase/CheY-like chemotaxis protein
MVVFAALAAISLTTALVLHEVVEDQERKLLRERAAEGSAFLSAMLNRTSSSLTLLGFVAETAAADPARFDAAATRIVGRRPGVVAVIREEPGRLVVSGAAGVGLEVGQVLTGERAALVRRAMTADGMVADRIDEAGTSYLGFALAPRSSSSGPLYQEVPLDPAMTLGGEEDSPFSELEGVLYASRTPDPDAVVVTTTEDFPLAGGRVHERLVSVGVDKWFLVVKARRPLVGSFAVNAPWGLLGAGLVVAGLVAALVEMVSRRRVYALALVDERTRELQEALEEKAHLEERERGAREAAEAANRSKSEFLSRMSHELRTPLNAVLGFAQLLELDDLTDSQRESVAQILRGGRHLLHLIDEVLDITSIESGRLTISLEPVLASDVLVDVLELSGPLAADRGIAMALDDADGAGRTFVRADVQRLKQILLNLVSNAIKYNHPGGAVTLSYDRPSPDTLRIRVADTGPGIAPEHHSLLFTPFERLGAEQTGVKGTGIGLALSRCLAEAMGATLDLESSPGKGSTFAVRLPVTESPAGYLDRVHGRGETVRHRTPGSETRRKIVYIEDNLSNLRLVEAILGEDNFDVVPAMQGRLGVELAREHQPALILLDMHLPDMDGCDVLEQLRDDPSTAAIPVIVVSADATARRVEQVLEAGAFAYITKPIDILELRALTGSIESRTP